MTPILSFTAGELGREVVRLGTVAVGEVAVHTGARARASFILHLPESRSSFRPAESRERVREIITREVSEWLLRAGVFYPGQTVEVEMREDVRAVRAGEARA